MSINQRFGVVIAVLLGTMIASFTQVGTPRWKYCFAFQLIASVVALVWQKVSGDNALRRELPNLHKHN